MTGNLGSDWNNRTTRQKGSGITEMEGSDCLEIRVINGGKTEDRNLQSHLVLQCIYLSGKVIECQWRLH